MEKKLETAVWASGFRIWQYYHNKGEETQTERTMQNEMSNRIWGLQGVGVSVHQGRFHRAPTSKDYSILGSILGSPFMENTMFMR